MRVLLIKMSSMGDVVHALPAVTDACAALPGLRVDWLVEEGFTAIAYWHPGVTRVIPIALRRWRAAPWRYRAELKAFIGQLRATRYDLVVDAQGLLKSALVALLAKGPRAGLDRCSAREPLASLFYQRRLSVPVAQHAVQRVRMLLAQALGYAMPDAIGVSGIAVAKESTASGSSGKRCWERTQQGSECDRVPYVVFLHGTSWRNKHWPQVHWRALAALAVADGYQVKVPGGTAQEQQAAERIVAGIAGAAALPAMSVAELGGWLARACGIAAVDTGLAHLGAAFGVPTLAMHGPTNAQRTGIYGNSGQPLALPLSCAPCGQRVCVYARPLAGALAFESAAATAGRTVDAAPPCMQDIEPRRVWEELRARMTARGRVFPRTQTNVAAMVGQGHPR